MVNAPHDIFILLKDIYETAMFKSNKLPFLIKI